MRLIDRYVGMEFIKATLFAIVAFCMLFIMVDMIENIDDFLDEHVPTHIITLYYIYFLPRIFSLMMPVAMLLAALFVAGKMSATNELTIITSGGVSLARFMVPFLLIGAVASGVMLVFDGWVEPRVNASRLRLEREYLKKHLATGGRYNLFFQESDGRILSLDFFDETESIARRIAVYRFDPSDATHTAERIDAAWMRWDPGRRKWRAFDVVHRRFTLEKASKPGIRETVTRYDSLDLSTSVVTPEIILRMQQKPEEMELGELRSYIERQRVAGSDINRLLVDYHGKMAFPFASLIVVFFGVPFASIKRRSGLSVQFGVSIFLCFIYLVSQKLSQVFGYNGSIPPLAAAWIPNLIFFLSGCGIMLRTRR
ncbi:MAG: LptF/LptG family permease [Bacteroidota bacterium]|nr:LptF/LptG family permease [Bacteroidota bacterium]